MCVLLHTEAKCMGDAWGTSSAVACDKLLSVGKVPQMILKTAKSTICGVFTATRLLWLVGSKLSRPVFTFRSCAVCTYIVSVLCPIQAVDHSRAASKRAGFVHSTRSTLNTVRGTGSDRISRFDSASITQRSR